jgi:hypothetical protein
LPFGCVHLQITLPISNVAQVLEMGVGLFVSHLNITARLRLTYSRQRTSQPIIWHARPILFHKLTVSLAKIVVQHNITPFMPRNRSQQRLQVFQRRRRDICVVQNPKATQAPSGAANFDFAPDRARKLLEHFSGGRDIRVPSRPHCGRTLCSIHFCLSRTPLAAACEVCHWPCSLRRAACLEIRLTP